MILMKLSKTSPSHCIKKTIHHLIVYFYLFSSTIHEPSDMTTFIHNFLLLLYISSAPGKKRRVNPITSGWFILQKHILAYGERDTISIRRVRGSAVKIATPHDYNVLQHKCMKISASLPSTSKLGTCLSPINPKP